ncbi:unnamed protein product [Clonostachys rosea f. rosea IK726]|uniref:Uncharacterized protein n=1 Tax=Clonostachys rosea f. rosea IK726 TaxID=1349383 RepID=A0ACA9U9U6_BIOOC|nr:unnamed protein product [Clonostachys rosea f. rosea IK726]
MDAAIVLDQLPVLPTGSSGAMSAAPLPTAEVSEHLADEGIKEQQAPSGQNVKGDKGAKPKRSESSQRRGRNRTVLLREPFKELGQRAKAEAKNQPGVKKHRELLPRGADTGKSITNHGSRLQVPSPPQMGCPRALTSVGSQNILALLPSPPDSTSPLPLPSETDRQLEEYATNWPCLTLGRTRKSSWKLQSAQPFCTMASHSVSTWKPSPTVVLNACPLSIVPPLRKTTR